LWTSARRAARILTVSETTKADILRYCDVPADRIVVIYNAIDDRFATPPDDHDVQKVRERYQLDGPFALYVGNIKPHKNLERLIEAFHLVRRGNFERLQLLIIGNQISKYPRLRRAVDRYKLHKHVRFLGFVPDKTLAALYRLATVFVFPSLYEGFGLPPLEAMKCGAPVIASDRGSIPEVVGDAGVIIDANDAAALAASITQLLQDRDFHDDLQRRGFARAEEFSWPKPADRILDIYRSALALPGKGKPAPMVVSS
jgi:glycosyltransferase involved in cell wall biosynthesis